jgi:hypothetical protein
MSSDDLRSDWYCTSGSGCTSADIRDCISNCRISHSERLAARSAGTFMNSLEPYSGLNIEITKEELLHSKRALVVMAEIIKTALGKNLPTELQADLKTAISVFRRLEKIAR